MNVIFFYTKYDIFNEDIIFFSKNKYIEDDIKFRKFTL